jgi:hypothetical protein
VNYDQKEFDAFTQGLMKQFQKEFKDSVQAIENIPKGPSSSAPSRPVSRTRRSKSRPAS